MNVQGVYNSTFTISVCDDTVIAIANETDPNLDYNWDFGDGNNSTERFPTHIYENGSYEVCLTVSNNIGNNTTCQEISLGVSDLGYKIQGQRFKV